MKLLANRVLIDRVARPGTFCRVDLHPPPRPEAPLSYVGRRRLPLKSADVPCLGGALTSWFLRGDSPRQRLRFRIGGQYQRAAARFYSLPADAGLRPGRIATTLPPHLQRPRCFWGACPASAQKYFRGCPPFPNSTHSLCKRPNAPLRPVSSRYIRSLFPDTNQRPSPSSRRRRIFPGHTAFPPQRVPESANSQRQAFCRS